jgi:enoyl-CoA hydratase/carnithine racemase
MILFGELYEAPALLAFGFFNEVAPDEGLDEAARRWADKVLRQPPLPVQMTKASINALVKALDRSIFHLDEYGLVLTGRSKDAARAKEAFFQDGRPDWGLE